MTTRHTAWISVGRNVGAEPMGAIDWQNLQAEVRQAVAYANGDIITTVQGQSDYQHSPEQTYLVLAELPALSVVLIAGHLADIAHDYHQEAIGFVCHQSTNTLIFATP